MQTLNMNDIEHIFKLAADSIDQSHLKRVTYLPKHAKSPAACCAGWVAKIAKQSLNVVDPAALCSVEERVVEHHRQMMRRNLDSTKHSFAMLLD